MTSYFPNKFDTSIENRKQLTSSKTVSGPIFVLTEIKEIHLDKL